MTPHFTWDISLGQIIISFPIFGMILMLIKLHSMLLLFRMEHEILMADWAKRHDVELHTIPTRQKKWW